MEHVNCNPKVGQDVIATPWQSHNAEGGRGRLCSCTTTAGAGGAAGITTCSSEVESDSPLSSSPFPLLVIRSSTFPLLDTKSSCTCAVSNKTDRARFKRASDFFFPNLDDRKTRNQTKHAHQPPTTTNKKESLFQKPKGALLVQRKTLKESEGEKKNVSPWSDLDSGGHSTTAQSESFPNSDKKPLKARSKFAKLRPEDRLFSITTDIHRTPFETKISDRKQETYLHIMWFWANLFLVF
jgi:hypothetical protein